MVLLKVTGSVIIIYAYLTSLCAVCNEEASMKPNLVAQNAALSACEKAKQWQKALILLEQLPEKQLTADDVSAYVEGRGAGFVGASFDVV